MNSETLNMRDAAKIFYDEFKPMGFHVSSHNLPYEIAYAVSFFNHDVKILTKAWGKFTQISSNKAEDMFHMKF